MEILTYRNYVPGLMSRIIEMQAKYYHRFYKFGLSYEVFLSNELALFLKNYDINQDILLYAKTEDEIIGSISIRSYREEEGVGQLLWYIMDENYIGYGVGSKLMQKALDFCIDQKFRKVFLWTFKGLDLAQTLYLKNGFKFVKERDKHEWETALSETLIEQYYEKLL